jgi:hypothetical protein
MTAECLLVSLSAVAIVHTQHVVLVGHDVITLRPRAD